MQKVRAEISLENIRHNAKAFLALTKTRLCAVVKANAYGHGAEAVVAALCDVVDSFAVALIEEGLAIRVAACGKEIVVLTPPTDEAEGYMLASCGFTAMVDSLKTARLLSKVCARYHLPLNVRLKVNTGMNRYGMNVQMLGKTCKLLQTDAWLRVRGMDSHLCECSIVRAKEQQACFEQMLSVARRYFPMINAYLCATYGALLGEKYHYDGVRVGLGLYGYLPCGVNEKTGVSLDAVMRLDLRKSMAVYAKAIGKRTHPSGGVGYGEKRKSLPSSLTVYRVGYADGFLRQRENGMDGWETNANVLCMDACIRQGDGRRGAYIPIMMDAEAVAAATGTVAYEVLCAATRRAEFIYDEETAFCRRGAVHKGRAKDKSSRVHERKARGKYQP